MTGIIHTDKFLWTFPQWRQFREIVGLWYTLLPQLIQRLYLLTHQNVFQSDHGKSLLRMSLLRWIHLQFLINTIHTHTQNSFYGNFLTGECLEKQWVSKKTLLPQLIQRLYLKIHQNVFQSHHEPS